ncbi:MAG: hydroxyacid dehydrogenase [Chitinispirillaceae bacterium]
MKIRIFEIEQWERDAFKLLEADNEVSYIEEPLNNDTAGQHEDADVVSTFIYSQLTKEVLSRIKNLKLIATRSTGFDHIDIQYCNEHDIRIAIVPTYGKNTVAEHAFALILTLSHRIVDSVTKTRRGEFSPEGLRGFDLMNKTLGVIGTGDIGEHAIQIAKGFGMNVLAFDVNPRQELKKRLAFDYVDMDTLLAQSDIITIHVPANPKTEDLISTQQFQKMKDGVVLINTSRGSVVNFKALSEALVQKKVSAAGLDVLPAEPLIREDTQVLRKVYQKDNEETLKKLLADNVLFQLDNVIVTPHNAFNTTEAVQRILATTCQNIDAFSKGEVVNVVNEQKLAHA